MAGKFELKQAKNGKFHFNLLAGNGQTNFSRQIKESEAAAGNGIASVQKNGGDESRFERLESKNGDPYFVLKAGNGQVIGQSEMYKSKASMENGIQSVMKNAPDAPTVEV